MKQLQVARILWENQFIDRIVDCVGFWNREGEKTYEANKTGTLGSPKSQEFARTVSYEEFVLTMLMTDCEVILRYDTSFNIKQEAEEQKIVIRQNSEIALIVQIYN